MAAPRALAPALAAVCTLLGLLSAAPGAEGCCFGAQRPSGKTLDAQAALLENISEGHFSTELVENYGALTDRWAQLLNGDNHSDNAEPFRVLIVSPVSNSAAVVANYGDNIRKLKNNSFGDTFDMWLFHYDNSSEEWEKAAWYSDKAGPVKKKHVGAGCKVQFWMMLGNDVAAQYDYIWLMDDDLRLDYFNWDLYRGMLARFDPLVSQPSVVGHVPGGRATDVHVLRMQKAIWDNKRVALFAKERRRTEVQTAIVSGRIWPALMERTKTDFDARSCWFMDTWWDNIALVASYHCGKPKPLLINACPVRHMNYQGLRQHAWVEGICIRRPPPHTNDRNVSDTEQLAVREALQGYCDLPRDWLREVCGDTKNAKINHCRSPDWTKNTYFEFTEHELYWAA